MADAPSALLENANLQASFSALFFCLKGQPCQTLHGISSTCWSQSDDLCKTVIEMQVIAPHQVLQPSHYSSFAGNSYSFLPDSVYCRFRKLNLGCFILLLHLFWGKRKDCCSVTVIWYWFVVWAWIRHIRKNNVSLCLDIFYQETLITALDPGALSVLLCVLKNEMVN